ncbi:hypothetical protein SEVIR_4G055101v4 [Setaria viridis]
MKMQNCRSVRHLLEIGDSGGPWRIGGAAEERGARRFPLLAPIACCSSSHSCPWWRRGKGGWCRRRRGGGVFWLTYGGGAAGRWAYGEAGGRRSPWRQPIYTYFTFTS